MCVLPVLESRQKNSAETREHLSSFSVFSWEICLIALEVFKVSCHSNQSGITGVCAVLKADV